MLEERSAVNWAGKNGRTVVVWRWWREEQGGGKEEVVVWRWWRGSVGGGDREKVVVIERKRWGLVVVVAGGGSGGV